MVQREKESKTNKKGSTQELLETYSIYMQTYEGTLDRQQRTHRFYLTMFSFFASVIIATIGFRDPEMQGNILGLLSPAFGISVLMALCYRINTKSIQAVLLAKLSILNQLEQQLPFACLEKERRQLTTRKKKYEPTVEAHARLNSGENVIASVLVAPLFLLYVLVTLLSLFSS